VPRLRALVPAAFVGLALIVSGGEATAKKMPAASRKPRPAPNPPPNPPGWGEANEIGNVGIVPAGPEAGGHEPSRPKPPLVEATATIWAQAGSRSWTGCSTVANEAAKQLWGSGEAVNSYRENHHWAIQAGECPNAPEVLAMAARSELLRRLELPEGLDGTTDLTKLEASLAESRDRALAWIDAAQAELMRRRDTRSLGLEYWRGRALLSTGDLVGARAAFQRALRLRSIEGWKLRRLLALTELYSGELDLALDLAKRAVIDAPASDKLASYYVLGLVLDRAGDSAGAHRRIQTALDRDDGSQRRALETAMPVHERLYLRALAKTVRNESSGALRLWDAYLARPEPENPERRLAERHQASLRPLPSNLGGPAHPDEGAAASGTPSGQSGGRGGG
jgi:tetratricopeptide (TPR) repeat protein